MLSTFLKNWSNFRYNFDACRKTLCIRCVSGVECRRFLDLHIYQTTLLLVPLPFRISRKFQILQEIMNFDSTWGHRRVVSFVIWQRCFRSNSRNRRIQRRYALKSKQSLSYRLIEHSFSLYIKKKSAAGEDQYWLIRYDSQCKTNNQSTCLSDFCYIAWRREIVDFNVYGQSTKSSANSLSQSVIS